MLWKAVQENLSVELTDFLGAPRKAGELWKTRVAREGGFKVVRCPGTLRKRPQRTRRQGRHWKTRKTQGDTRDHKETAGRRRRPQGRRRETQGIK